MAKGGSAWTFACNCEDTEQLRLLYYNRAVEKSNCRKEKTRYSRTGPFQLEGGDSEWFINYLRFIIKGICKQSVSKF